MIMEIPSPKRRKIGDASFISIDVDNYTDPQHTASPVLIQVQSDHLLPVNNSNVRKTDKLLQEKVLQRCIQKNNSDDIVFNQMKEFSRHGNIYSLLNLTVDTPRNEVKTAIKAKLKWIETICSNYSEDKKTILIECKKKLNVSISIFSDESLRKIYLSLVLWFDNLKSKELLYIPFPSCEVNMISYIRTFMLSVACAPVLWKQGFPIKTENGFAWVDGKTLHATVPPSAVTRDTKINSLRSILKSIDKNVAAAIEGSPSCSGNQMFCSLHDLLMESIEWKQHSKLGHYISYENGILDMNQLIFREFDDVYMDLKSTSSEWIESCDIPVAFIRHPFHFDAEDKLILNEISKSSHLDIKTRASTWHTLPGYKELLSKMPLFHETLMRQPMTSNSEVQSYLYKNLGRGFGHLEDKPAARSLFFLGASGCAKSTITDVFCMLVGQNNCVSITHDTRDRFAEEVTIGKRVLVFSDISDKNQISFEQLSNASDRNERAINRKNVTYQVCSPPSLIMGTSNFPAIIQIPRGRKLNAEALSCRIAPFIFNETISNMDVNNNMRKKIYDEEGKYITLMILAHSQHEYDIPSILSASAAWIANKIACPTLSKSKTSKRTTHDSRSKHSTKKTSRDHSSVIWHTCLKEIHQQQKQSKLKSSWEIVPDLYSRSNSEISETVDIVSLLSDDDAEDDFIKRENKK